MHVSLSPEILFYFHGIPISNSTLTSWIVVVFLLVGAFTLRGLLQMIPGAIQAAVELIYEGFYNLAHNAIPDGAAADRSLPFALTLFFYIIVSNLVGLLPGFETLTWHSVPLLRAPTSDLNTTICLAVLTMGYVQYMGISYLGARQYLGKFFSFKSPLDFMVGIQELISELTRIISFSFRLFGNVFAGEMLISVITFLTSTYLPYLAIFPLPFYVLESGFAVIQAFVFAFLMIVFTGLAITSHESGHGIDELAIA